ncbi:MAG: Phage tail tube protein [Bacteroidota bacterium]|jgi:TP901-1 family phage major tail protein
MAIYNGTAQLLKLGTAGSEETLIQLTNCSMSVNADLFDTTSKESGGWKSVMPGLRDVSYSGEGLADFAAGANYTLTEIFAAYNNRTLLSVKFTNGTNTFSQSGYIASFEISGPMEDVATYTIEVTGTGVLTLV